MKAFFKKHILEFNSPVQTSRETLEKKETYLLTIEKNGKVGVGECALFKGLSYDDVESYEKKMQWTCENISKGFIELYKELMFYPSIQFGVEQAFLNLEQEKNIYFKSAFTEGKDCIKINGLIWMGNYQAMFKQVEEKIKAKFSCIKIKIDNNNWESQYAILKKIRQDFSADQIEIRVDANGALDKINSLTILNQLAELKIHSIEQPIKQGQFIEMKELCKISPISIALDEELIGVFSLEKKKELLLFINPQYIILKPSLIGGFKGSEEWINLANELKIKWWVTSALESNVGLNAIAQWTYTLNNTLPQGLGTGSLFSNNFPTSLNLVGEKLFYNP